MNNKRLQDKVAIVTGAGTRGPMPGTGQRRRQSRAFPTPTVSTVATYRVPYSNAPEAVVRNSSNFVSYPQRWALIVNKS